MLEDLYALRETPVEGQVPDHVREVVIYVIDKDTGRQVLETTMPSTIRARWVNESPDCFTYHSGFLE